MNLDDDFLLAGRGYGGGVHAVALDAMDISEGVSGGREQGGGIGLGGLVDIGGRGFTPARGLAARWA